MAPPSDPRENNRHSKRITFDATEWRDRLEQLAEMRRREAAKDSDDKRATEE
jgi:hypothetical protein